MGLCYAAASTPRPQPACTLRCGRRCPFNPVDNTPTRLATVGFRVVLSATAAENRVATVAEVFFLQGDAHMPRRSLPVIKTVRSAYLSCLT